LKKIYLDHIYLKKEDCRELSLQLLQISQKLNENIKLEYQCRAICYYSTNLALRGFYKESFSLYLKLSIIPQSLFLIQVLSNRTVAYIGRSAFMHGDYLLSYSCFHDFRNRNSQDKKDFQAQIKFFNKLIV
jgi:hypothetical protein